MSVHTSKIIIKQITAYFPLQIHNMHQENEIPC